MIHGLYFFLETRRGRRVDRPELSVARDKDQIAASGVLPTDASNKGGGLCSLLADSDGLSLRSNTAVTDIDIVTAGSVELSGAKTNSDIVRAVVAEKSETTNGRVADAGPVANKRSIPIGGIVMAHCIGCQRGNTGGRIAAAGGVAKECIYAGGRVLDTGCVAFECGNTTGCIVVARGVLRKRQ